MSVKERLDLERDDRRHESTQARLADRLKFACCCQCGSEDGWRSMCRSSLRLFCATDKAIEVFAPWYRDPNDDAALYHSCVVCNYSGKRIPDSMEQLSTDEVAYWRDDTDPMAPDYDALAAEPGPALASEIDCDSAELEG